MHTAYLPEAWHNLYLMLGTSSAALIGLLFVATSLHLSEIVNDAVYKLRAEYTTLIMFGTLVQATAILTPQPLQILGAELLVLNLVGISFPFQLLHKASKVKASPRRGRFLDPPRGFFHCRVSARYRRQRRHGGRRGMGHVSGDGQLRE
jgi:hypothetical protein